MSFDHQPEHSAGPPPRDEQASSFFPVPVHTADIYQAALNRARQDHELDRLFNPEFYDYEI